MWTARLQNNSGSGRMLVYVACGDGKAGGKNIA
jgi:hypothetical protein